MRWSDGSHRPRLMTVEEFEEWDRTKNQPTGHRVPTHYPDGTVGPPYISVMTLGVSFPRGTRLKTKLTRWNRWRDRRWEKRQARRGGSGRDR